jgi:hypothetical protein
VFILISARTSARGSFSEKEEKLEQFVLGGRLRERERDGVDVLVILANPTLGYFF